MESHITLSPARKASVIEIVETPDAIVVQSSATSGERRRNQLRWLGTLLAVAGLALSPFHWGLLALAPLGLAAALLGPSYVKQSELFRVQRGPGDRLLSGSANLQVSCIDAFSSRYETNGWEGRTCVFAQLTTGEECLLLEIGGTDDTCVKAVCEALARLCNCPVENIGPFGERTHYLPDDVSARKHLLINAVDYPDAAAGPERG
jgi:hypothetical protein